MRESDITEPLSKHFSATDSRSLEDYFPNAICRAASGRGCQANISLINERLLKFHKSNPVTRFTHAQSALMECSNVSFSHFGSRAYLIHFCNSCFVFQVVISAGLCKGGEKGEIRTQTRPPGIRTPCSCSWMLRENDQRYGSVTFITIFPWKRFTRQLLYTIFPPNLCSLAQLPPWVQS